MCSKFYGVNAALASGDVEGVPTWQAEILWPTINGNVPRWLSILIERGERGGAGDPELIVKVVTGTNKSYPDPIKWTLCLKGMLHRAGRGI